MQSKGRRFSRTTAATWLAPPVWAVVQNRPARPARASWKGIPRDEKFSASAASCLALPVSAGGLAPVRPDGGGVLERNLYGHRSHSPNSASRKEPAGDHQRRDQENRIRPH